MKKTCLLLNTLLLMHSLLIPAISWADPKITKLLKQQTYVAIRDGVTDLLSNESLQNTVFIGVGSDVQPWLVFLTELGAKSVFNIGPESFATLDTVTLPDFKSLLTTVRPDSGSSRVVFLSVCHDCKISHELMLEAQSSDNFLPEVKAKSAVLITDSASTPELLWTRYQSISTDVSENLSQLPEPKSVSHKLRQFVPPTINQKMTGDSELKGKLSAENYASFKNYQSTHQKFTFKNVSEISRRLQMSVTEKMSWILGLARFHTDSPEAWTALSDVLFESIGFPKERMLDSLQNQSLDLLLSLDHPPLAANAIPALILAAKVTQKTKQSELNGKIIQVLHKLDSPEADLLQNFEQSFENHVRQLQAKPTDPFAITFVINDIQNSYESGNVFSNLWDRKGAAALAQLRLDAVKALQALPKTGVDVTGLLLVLEDDHVSMEDKDRLVSILDGVDIPASETTQRLMDEGNTHFLRWAGFHGVPGSVERIAEKLISINSFFTSAKTQHDTIKRLGVFAVGNPKVKLLKTSTTYDWQYYDPAPVIIFKLLHEYSRNVPIVDWSINQYMPRGELSPASALGFTLTWGINPINDVIRYMTAFPDSPLTATFRSVLKIAFEKFALIYQRWGGGESQRQVSWTVSSLVLEKGVTDSMLVLLNLASSVTSLHPDGTPHRELARSAFAKINFNDPTIVNLIFKLSFYDRANFLAPMKREDYEFGREDRDRIIIPGMLEEMGPSVLALWKKGLEVSPEEYTRLYAVLEKTDGAARGLLSELRGIVARGNGPEQAEINEALSSLAASDCEGVFSGF